MSNVNAFRVGPSFDGTMSWWVAHQLPGYTPPGMRLPTVEEAEIMERMEWSLDTPEDAVRLRALLNPSTTLKEPPNAA